MSEEIKTNEAERNVSPEKSKLSKADKRLEKLTALKEKYEKASSVQAEAARKADSINAQIEKIKMEIHAEEIAEIDRLCAEKGLTYSDISRILKAVPDGMTADEIINYFA